MGIVIFLGISLIGLLLKTLIFNKSSLAAISISSIPKATVFIDGNQVGTTPYLNDKLQSGEHLVKLIPESNVDGLVPWEQKVILNSNVLTVVNRVLGSNIQNSAGEVTWLEKINSKDKSSITVVSSPDQAVVKIDNEPKGFAPLMVEDINPGGYQIAVSSTGYEERIISARTVAGYKLIINVQLAKKSENIEEKANEGGSAEAILGPTPTGGVGMSSRPTPQPTSSFPQKPYVKIKETPTGWLRVRMEPGTSATEAAKIKPGEIFPYLGEEKIVSGTKWYKIEYEKNKEGWISGIYVELVE